MFEYGSRIGFWRVHRMLHSRGMTATVLGCGLALERNPEVCEAIKAAGYDVCAHGWRWERHQTLTLEEERDRIRRTVESITRSVGARPLGWYCRYGPSLNTRALLVEEGGFLYDSDTYNDELPYWTQVGDKPHLLVPYGLANNDAKFIRGGMATGQDLFKYLRDAFDVLYEEGSAAPKMMSVGLHLRLVGQPGRAAAARIAGPPAGGHRQHGQPRLAGAAFAFAQQAGEAEPVQYRHAAIGDHQAIIAWLVG
ncbi:hypothetical protein G6F68_011460 [Rhizopus microsporus]|nr:hypothetical protein G6F68_011460 [Rhizopus microsporus]